MHGLPIQQNASAHDMPRQAWTSAPRRGWGGGADKRLRLAREEAELRRRTELAEVEERKNTHIQARFLVLKLDAESLMGITGENLALSHW